MGVLDDAIREHLDLKRRRGASAEEIARAEAEALGPPRRSTVFDDEAEDPFEAEHDRAGDDEPEHHAVATRLIEPMEDVAPPPPRAPTRAVHDIDEELDAGGDTDEHEALTVVRAALSDRDESDTEPSAQAPAETEPEPEPTSA